MRLELLVFFIAVTALVSAHQNRKGSGSQYGQGDRYYSQSYGGGGFNNQPFYGRPYYNGGGHNGVPGQGGRCGRQLNKRSCQLHDFGSNLVTKDEFINQVMDQSNGWLPLLTIETNSDKLGKCNHNWGLPDADDIFTRQEVCYNLDQNECKIFSEISMITEDECGRVKIVGVNSTTTESFYSQDLDKYMWRDLCVDRQGDECTGGGYMDLNVRGDRYINTPDGAADITGIPWDKVAADLKNVFNKDIEDPEVRHSFLGEACPFPF